MIIAGIAFLIAVLFVFWLFLHNAYKNGIASGLLALSLTVPPFALGFIAGFFTGIG